MTDEERWRAYGESLGAVWNELARNMGAMVGGFMDTTDDRAARAIREWRALPWYVRLWEWLRW